MTMPLSVPALSSKSDLLARELSQLHLGSLKIATELHDLEDAAWKPILRTFAKAYLEQNNWQICRLREAIEHEHPYDLESPHEGIDAILSEVSGAMNLHSPPVIQDAALSGMLMRLIHCRIADFRSAMSLAHHLGRQEVSDMLQAALDDEETAAARLASIEEAEIDPSAATAAEPENKQDTGIFG